MCYECATSKGQLLACSAKHIRVTVKYIIILEPLSVRKNEKITCACGCGVIGCKTEE
jgi:hypothetical protein